MTGEIKPIRYSKATPWQRKAIREMYIVSQGGLCYFCKSLIHEKPPEKITNLKINWALFPKDFLKYPIHLQHNHDTDLTEGAVHSYCNAVMWQYFGK